jgi:malate dehydrogenase (oxaloacetate-decarboxylating)
MKRQSPSYSLTLRLRYPDRTGQLGRITSAIGEAEGMIGAVDIVDVRRGMIIRDITVNARDVEHGQQIVERLHAISGVSVVRVSDRTYLYHLGGKIEVRAKAPIKTRDDLSMAYTPGVARVCRSIAADPDAAFTLTVRHNGVAVVTDGSAVLGLGNIGPRAALPVMEGKAMLFKEFAGVNAFPLCLDTQDAEKIIETCIFLAPTFGGINLEDISSPRCVEIEERLAARLEIPVFHDDQHGTAIVVLAALQNAAKIVQKNLQTLRVTLCGSGAAGQAIAKLLKLVGMEQIVACDKQGALSASQYRGDNPVKRWIAENTNPERLTGSLGDVIRGADVFLGVSAANVLTEDDVKKMSKNPILFALANPDPEIDPDLAAPHAAVIATGRSDYPNQINNVLCFPGFFRGLLDVRAPRVIDAMKIAAAEAIAGVIPDKDLLPDYIVPSVFDRRVASAVAKAVAKTAQECGIARREHKPGFRISP